MASSFRGEKLYLVHQVYLGKALAAFVKQQVHGALGEKHVTLQRDSVVLADVTYVDERTPGQVVEVMLGFHLKRASSVQPSFDLISLPCAELELAAESER